LHGNLLLGFLSERHSGFTRRKLLSWSTLAAGCLALLFGLLATVFATLLAARFGSFTAGLLAMLSTTLLAARTAAGGLIFGC